MNFNCFAESFYFLKKSFQSILDQKSLLLLILFYCCSIFHFGILILFTVPSKLVATNFVVVILFYINFMLYITIILIIFIWLIIVINNIRSQHPPFSNFRWKTKKVCENQLTNKILAKKKKKLCLNNYMRKILKKI